MEKFGRIDVLTGITKIEKLLKSSDETKDEKEELNKRVEEVRAVVSDPSIRDEDLQPLGENLRKDLSGIKQLDSETAERVSSDLARITEMRR